MSRQINRIAAGGQIRRDKPISFIFNGSTLNGFEGDTLASALLANGVSTVSRSFKYHRRRGIQGAGCEDVGAIVQLLGRDGAPNILATQQALFDGLQARSLNCWPSVEYDLGSGLQYLSPLLPSGFYYKTFMWPHWHAFEPFIRKAAGFGTAPDKKPEKPYENRFGHCDVLIVGAGPAGLSAAQTSARAGARVLLVDESLQPGGSLRWQRAVIDGIPVTQWVAKVVDELDASQHVERLQNATVWGYHEGNLLTIVERSPQPADLGQRNRRVWARQVILAGGAIERPIIFENNDLPGVMFSKAVQTYIKCYAVKPGNRAVLFTNNDCAYQSLWVMLEAGISVVAVVDVRGQVTESLRLELERCGVRLITSAYVKKALGKKYVKGVEVALIDSNSTHTIECDLLSISGGWNPAVHLHSQSRGSLKYDVACACFRPHKIMQASISIGGANADFTLAECLANGHKAALDSLYRLGFQSTTDGSILSEHEASEYSIEAFWGVPYGRRRVKAFADLAGDVTLADLDLAVQEGYSEIEHLKRYTTTGMGFDQGKTANVNTIGIVANLQGKSLPEVGTTTFRPPYSLVEFGAIAGSRSDSTVLPYRHTPMTELHKKAKAVMFEAGARWQRPSYYPAHPKETLQQAMYRESLATREAVTMYDGSPLGKFELKGPDVIKLLNLIYTNCWNGLEIGQGRYAVMLTEDGLMFDDGVTFRVERNRYLMSGATGNAPALQGWLDRLLNVERPDLQVLVTPQTSQWANVTVCGPQARDVLLSMAGDIDLSLAAFPFMHCRKGVLGGLPVRIFRVSFTGELSFEINTPRRYGAQLWQAVAAAGEPFGICPIGSEANHLLRVEKGFLSFGHEVDGVTDPYDLGLGWLVSKKKDDFIGKRAMEIRRRGNPVRRELVGLLSEDTQKVIAEGAPITPGGAATDSEGFVSAAVWSVVNKRSIALALLNNGRARHGETVYVRVKGEVIPALVTKPVFYDPKGERLRM